MQEVAAAGGDTGNINLGALLEGGDVALKKKAKLN